MSHYDALLAHLGDVIALRDAAAILSYDQQTAMPRGGAEARGRQMAVLARMAHERFTSDTTGELLEAATAASQADPESDEARHLAIVREDYTKQRKFPAAFVAEYTLATTAAFEAWAQARAANDFAMFQPHLEKVMALTQQSAEYIGYAEHPYDALIGDYERGMTTARVQAIFEAHRPALVELIAAIKAAPQVDDSVLHRHYPQAAQASFAKWATEQIGFDYRRGGTATVVHPFCTSFSVNDVRITTRFDEQFFNPAFFGMLHEAGHGLYEQGVAQALDNTMLRGGTSLGVHESQSRLWENIVGRSEGFWRWALPHLKAAFPGVVDEVDVAAFHKAINQSAPSFIRVEADEATYNLHIILRFELEQALLTGALAVKDLPQAWNDRFEAYFGMRPANDAQGCLQDVHWSSGLIGYFPTYALGNILSVQYYEAALSQHPNIPAEIEQGKFTTLLGWLRENIHQHGRKFTGEELTQRITGESINPAPYMGYLRRKYSAVYGL